MKPTNRESVVHLLERVELPYPLDDARSAFPTRRGGFLLDGGGFTLFGAEPTVAFRAYRAAHRTRGGALAAQLEVEEHGAVVRTMVDDPLVALRAWLRDHEVPASEYVGAPLPLLAGAVGYIGYETGQMLERLPALARDRGAALPDIALFFHDWILGRSRATGETWLSVVGRGSARADARAAAERTRDRVVRALAEAHAATPRAPRSLAQSSALAVTLGDARAMETIDRASYLAKIERAKDHIACGDAFEICLTHRLDAPFAGDPFALFSALRDASPAPYAAFLDLPEGAIASSSPERFLALDRARVAESRPIKGTRPRGATREHDERLAADLAMAAKDRAENAMIVDLVRNDLGKVCKFGTVVAPELFAVERHPTVHQLVSTIRGELDEGRDVVDLVRACFPPGSMTGAPKIEAMSILEQLEPTERGPYGGALGWIDFSGTADLSVVIRTIVVRDGRAHVHVGGAIVADSDPDAEHAETLHKARGPLFALSFQEPHGE